MALTQQQQLALAFKKLVGVSHTTPYLDYGAEPVTSFVQGAAGNFFATKPTAPTSQLNTYTTGSIVDSAATAQVVDFEVSFIGSSLYDPANGTLTGTTIDDTFDADNSPFAGNAYHAFALKLPANYSTNPDYETNPNYNQSPYNIAGYHLSGSNGAVQCIPLSFGLNYAPKLYIDNTEIPLATLSVTLDPSTGVFFVQDIPQTYATDFTNGTIATRMKVRAALYVGQYGSSGASAGGFVTSGSGQNKVVALDTGSGYRSLNIFSASLNLSGSLNITGSTVNILSSSINYVGSGTETISITLTGSQDIIISGSNLAANAAPVNTISLHNVNIISNAASSSLTGSFRGSFTDNQGNAITNTPSTIISSNTSASIVASGSGTTGFITVSSSFVNISSSTVAITGSTTIIGTATLSGSAFVSGNIIPSVDNAFTLGNATNRWGSLAVTNISHSVGTASFANGKIVFDPNGNAIFANTTTASFLGQLNVTNTTTVATSTKYVLINSGSITNTRGGLLNVSATSSSFGLLWQTNGGGSTTGRWTAVSGANWNNDTDVGNTPYQPLISVTQSAIDPATNLTPNYRDAVYNGTGELYVNTTTGDVFIYS